MIYLPGIGNMVLHIITLGLMYFTVRQFTVYIGICMMMPRLSEGMFYVCVCCDCLMKSIKSEVSVALCSEGWGPLKSLLASAALCFTL